jgi:class 3 adenylate cyclase
MTTDATAAGATTGVVTILVTDQVGSTELRSRLGDDAADRALRAHTLLLREAVAAAGGREVKHLGDGLLATFASPSSALRCAVAIQQAVHRHNRRPGTVATQVRIGLDVGEVSTEEGDWFGTTVVVATRLCQLAGGGGIVASDLVRRLVGSRGGFDFGPPEDRALKGIPEPVAACRVSWVAPEATTVALPPDVAEPGATTFIGRSGELERLATMWDEARRGRPRLVVLAGDPGIGKTRLAFELARTVAAEGATVLLGRCEEDSLSPYQPLVEPFRHYVLSRPPEQLAAELRGTAAELASLVPEVLRRVPVAPVADQAAVDRYRVFEAAAGLVREAASGAPLLMVLDDLQWAEKPALMLLRHLVRHMGDAPVLVVATCREAELASVPGLADVVAGLRRERLVEVLTVGGLAEREVAALVHELGGQRSPAGFVRAVFTTTEGNPLFVESLLRHLDDTGATSAAGRAAVAASVGGLGLPEDVKEVIARRLSRMTERSQRALAVASVIGRQFGAPLLREVAGLGDDELVEVLEEAVAARVVVEVPGPEDCYAFHHAVTRQVLYEGLLGLRRTGLHRRIGAALAAENAAENAAPSADRLAQLAHHFLAAASGQPDDDDTAVAYAYAAASGALAGVAFEAAAVLCERALRVLERCGQPDLGRRLDVLLLLGRAHCRAGDTNEARKAFGQATEAALALGTSQALCETALTYAEVPVESGDVDERLVEVLEAAAAALPGDDPHRARLLARLVEELYFTPERERCMALSDEALSIARATGDPEALVDALNVRRLLLIGPDGPKARLAVSEELVTIAVAADDCLAVLRGRVARVVDLVDAGYLDGIDAEIEAVARLAEEARQPAWAWYPAKWRAMRALMAGRIDEGEKLAAAALAVGERPHGKTAFQAFVVQLVEIRRCQGRLAELEANMAAGITEYRAVPAWRCGLAWLHAALGRDADARRELDDLAAARFASLHDDFTWLTCASMLSEVAVHLGDAERSGVLFDLLLPSADHFMFAGQAELFGGCVARYLGQLATALGRWREAEGFLLDGRERAALMGARPEVARTELALARLYDARGERDDPHRADAAAERCATEANDLGLHALARRAFSR